ncbi:Uncharacterised protein [uncultured archaeon]|nr:Uncharacterised protein [uncultured archaeon]
MSIGFDGNLLFDAHGGYEIGSALGNFAKDGFETLLANWRSIVDVMFKETSGFCPVRDEKNFAKLVENTIKSRKK